MSAQEARQFGSKMIGKIKVGEPAAIEKYKPLPRRSPQYDWPAVFSSVPKGSYVDLRREDGTPWSWTTVYVAIKRLVKQGIVQNGEFKVRTQKLTSGLKVTLLFHYDQQKPELTTSKKR